MTTIDLSAFFQTKSQASDFSSRLASIAEKIYETNFNLEKALMEEFGLKKKDIFMTILRDQKVAHESHTELQKFLIHLQQTITALPILSLKIAFEPKEQTLKALSEWFVINNNRQLVFDITVDPGLIAGAVISFNGRDLDYSIREKFNTITQNFLAKQNHETQNAKPA